MTTRPARSPSAPSAAARPSWGPIVDAVGHCVLVFAFVPPLAALPRWLAFEATNPLNREDPVVLAFVPVRGLIVLVSAFLAGAVPGVLAGALDGVLVATWHRRRGGTSDRRRRILLGAICGALAAAAMVLGVVSVQGADGVPSAATLAFEIASGVVCGVVATPGALRLLSAAPRFVAGDRQRARASASASQ